MAEITCMECKTTVSEESGYCPECGYPFDTPLTPLDNSSSEKAPNDPQPAVNDKTVDIILQTLDSVRREINELKNTVVEIRQNTDSHATLTAENTQKALGEIASKLDTMVSIASIKEAEAKAAPPKKTKKELLAAFYKTLNSPNSMFEYMFYICIVQIIFVVVNLFLVTYIVTLVR